MPVNSHPPSNTNEHARKPHKVTNSSRRAKAIINSIPISDEHVSASIVSPRNSTSNADINLTTEELSGNANSANDPAFLFAVRGPQDLHSLSAFRDSSRSSQLQNYDQCVPDTHGNFDPCIGTRDIFDQSPGPRQ
eukprot:GILI01008297.1.p1 GENE.GILI01008297.1~~GILI01008297.1.p1  ORF type:complete len:150 (+),score=1.13 GILI01008297.1:47-451(+)